MKNIKSVCVYCSASRKIDALYEKDAWSVGKLIADRGLELVYGGNKSGLMNIVANAALENGGHVAGYTTKYLLETEGGHDDIQEMHIVCDMNTRKKSMYERSDAFIVLPGGIGTLEEFFEVLSWKELRLHHKPILIINSHGYWDNLKDLVKNMVDQNFVPASVWETITFVDDVTKIPEVMTHQLNTKLPKYKWGEKLSK